MLGKHLKKSQNLFKKDYENVQFADRDATKYREFVMKTYKSRDQVDPFTNFWVKEAGKVERIHKMHDDIEKTFEHLKSKKDVSKETAESIQEAHDTFYKKVEDMLIENDRENEDTFAFIDQFKVETKINYNL